MALRVGDIAAENYVQQTKKQNTAAGTTITPFSKMMEEETKKVTQEKEASSAQTTSQTASAGSVAKTTGTTGTVKSDGTLTTTLDDIFKRASEKYGVSYDFLVAVAKAESDFNPKCVSSAGAKGIMQIMPYEAKELGVDDVFDAEQNIMASAKLLAAHLKKFNGDTTLAAAAYNAGSGRVKQYGGDDGTDNSDDICSARGDGSKRGRDESDDGSSRKRCFGSDNDIWSLSEIS